MGFVRQRRAARFADGARYLSKPALGGSFFGFIVFDSVGYDAGHECNALHSAGSRLLLPAGPAECPRGAGQSENSPGNDEGYLGNGSSRLTAFPSTAVERHREHVQRIKSAEAGTVVASRGKPGRRSTPRGWAQAQGMFGIDRALSERS